MIVGRGRCTPVTGRRGRQPPSPVWATSGHYGCAERRHAQVSRKTLFVIPLPRFRLTQRHFCGCCLKYLKSGGG